MGTAITKPVITWPFDGAVGVELNPMIVTTLFANGSGISELCSIEINTGSAYNAATTVWTGYKEAAPFHITKCEAVGTIADVPYGWFSGTRAGKTSLAAGTEHNLRVTFADHLGAISADDIQFTTRAIGSLADQVLDAADGPDIHRVGQQLCVVPNVDEKVDNDLWQETDVGITTRVYDGFNVFNRYCEKIDDAEVADHRAGYAQVTLSTSKAGRRFIGLIWLRAPVEHDVSIFFSTGDPTSSGTVLTMRNIHATADLALYILDTGVMAGAGTDLYIGSFGAIADYYSPTGYVYVERIEVREILETMVLPTPNSILYEVGEEPNIAHSMLDGSIRTWKSGIKPQIGMSFQYLNVDAESARRRAREIAAELKGERLLVFPSRSSDWCYFADCGEGDSKWFAGKMLGYEADIAFTGTEIVAEIPGFYNGGF